MGHERTKIELIRDLGYCDPIINRALVIHKGEITYDALVDMVIAKHEQYERVYEDYVRLIKEAPAPRFFATPPTGGSND